jgi:nitroreductase
MKLSHKLLQVVPKPVRRRFRRLWWPLIVRFPRFGAVYYFFDDTFLREFRGVIQGHRHFERHQDGRRYTLRRNTHRLEKGLIMRPQKGVFARDYLPQTVELYLQLIHDPDCQQDEVTRELTDWAGGVLAEYFAVVSAGQDKAIDRAREQFEAGAPAARKPEARPYARGLDEPPPVSYEQMLALARRRRSVRWYRPDPVPREAIDQAVRVAGMAPSACNRQPFEFRVYDEPALVRKIAAIPGGTAGFHENFPCFIVIVGKLGAFPEGCDRHVIYIDASLAAMSLQFALESQGLSSCCINWRDIPEAEKAMAEALNLSPDERVVMCLSVGYPDPTGKIPFSQKKTLDELRRYNVT